MLSRGVGLADLALGQAVVAEEQVVGVTGQLLRQQMAHGLEVFRPVVEGRQDEQPAARGPRPCAFDGCGAGGAGVLRIERHEQDFVHRCGRQCLEGVLQARCSIPHSQGHGDVDPLPQRSGEALAPVQQGRAGFFVPPDRLICPCTRVGPPPQDQGHDETPHGPWRVDDVSIHQERVQIAAHRVAFGRVGGTEIGQQNAASGQHATRVGGGTVIVVARVRVDALGGPGR